MLRRVVGSVACFDSTAINRGLLHWHPMGDDSGGAGDAVNIEDVVPDGDTDNGETETEAPQGEQPTVDDPWSQELPDAIRADFGGATTLAQVRQRYSESSREAREQAEQAKIYQFLLENRQLAGQSPAAPQQQFQPQSQPEIGPVFGFNSLEEYQSEMQKNPAQAHKRYQAYMAQQMGIPDLQRELQELRQHNQQTQGQAQQAHLQSQWQQFAAKNPEYAEGQPGNAALAQAFKSKPYLETLFWAAAQHGENPYEAILPHVAYQRQAQVVAASEAKERERRAMAGTPKGVVGIKKTQTARPTSRAAATQQMITKMRAKGMEVSQAEEQAWMREATLADSNAGVRSK